MDTRRLGSSDLEITPIIFGAWAVGGSMWGGQDERDAIAAIHAALDAGVNTIDTAPIYGRGASEELVGKALAGRRDGVIIATKCGLNWSETSDSYKFSYRDTDGMVREVYNDLRPQRIRKECEDSLRRLRVDVLDLYQVHWPHPLRPVEEAFSELVKLRDEGKVRHLGVSNFSVPELETALRVGGIVSNQPQYNLLDRKIEADILPFSRQHGIGQIVYSPMARGLLTGKYGPEHKFPETDHRANVPWFHPAFRTRLVGALGRMRDMAAAKGCSMGNLAVAWTLGEPGVTAAIVGARNAAQATENAGAATVSLSAEERAELGRWFAAVG